MSNQRFLPWATAALAILISGGVLEVARAGAGESSSANATQAGMLPSPRPLSSTSPHPLLDAYDIDARSMVRGAKGKSGKQLFAAHGDGFACITDAGGSGHCAPEAGLRQGLGFGMEQCVDDLPSDMLRVTGMTPTGMTHVTLTAPGGQTWTTTPVAGTVVFEVPRAIARDGSSAAIRWSGPDGEGASALPLPPDVATAVCG